MVKKYLAVIIILHIVAAVIFFGVRYIGNTKKTVNVSVTELAEQESGINKQEIEVRNQESGTDGQVQNNDQQPTESIQNTTDNTQQLADNAKQLIGNMQQSKDDEQANEKPADTSKGDEMKTSSGKIVNKLISWGFQKSSGRTIKAVIVHTSYNALGGDVFDFDKVIKEWKDAGVSPHYAIDRDGTIYQLVSDQNIAWHAGVSKLPDGTTDVNGVSIGIEIINSQDAKFANEQYAALNSLIATLKKKYEIKYVLGHDDIAPGRKTDPWGIEWGKVRK